jgi:hypothetical protein
VDGAYTSSYLAAAVVNGTPSAVYGKGNPNTLYYGTYVGAAWTKTAITNTHKTSFVEPTLADVNGTAYVAYTGDPGGVALVLAHVAGGSVINETIATGIGITVASVGGRPAVVYQRTSPSAAVIYARWDGASWQSSTIEAVTAKYQLALTTWGDDPLAIYGSFYTGLGLSYAAYNPSTESWDTGYVNASQVSTMFPRAGSCCQTPLVAAFYRNTCLVFSYDGSWTQLASQPYLTKNNDNLVPCSATGVADFPAFVTRIGATGSEELWYYESSAA